MSTEKWFESDNIVKKGLAVWGYWFVGYFTIAFGVLAVAAMVALITGMFN